MLMITKLNPCHTTVHGHYQQITTHHC